LRELAEDQMAGNKRKRMKFYIPQSITHWYALWRLRVWEAAKGI
jgi:hypothetical protein